VQLPDPVVSATTILGVGNFTLDKPGPYWIEVIIDDVLKLRYALPVFQVNQQQPPGTGAPQSKPDGDAPAAGA
jgi:hypothetical protein